jgi:hypothetical protein
MKKKTGIKLIFLLIICLQTSWAQTVEIQGKIVSESSDLENINVYNSTSKKGVITNVNGAFTIAVKPKDILVISAISFKEVKVIISEEIIKSKTVTILVKEEVNTLDEVVILTHNLSGELVVDVDNADYFQPIPISMGNMDNLDFEDIRMNKPDNVLVKKGELYNGFDPVEILKLFGVSFKKKKKLTYEELKARDAKKIYDLADVYAPKYISDNFNIPLDKVEAFYAFLEVNQLDYELLKKENEVHLLEFLLTQSKVFLKNINGQD